MVASEPWGHLVTVIAGDMRSLPSAVTAAASRSGGRAAPTPPAPGTVDLLISELLGSFGDNELSPECLDGVQALLRPASLGGLGSIPAASTSQLAPVMTPKLWDDIRGSCSGAGAGGGVTGPGAVAALDLKWFETPYVVRFHRHRLLAPPQPVFTFEHPNPEAPRVDNRRFARLRFVAPDAGLMHGFAGYFDCVVRASE